MSTAFVHDYGWMGEQFESFIKTLQRILTALRYIGPIHRRLGLHVFDNFTRENKNRFLFSYLQSFVRWEMFDQIQVTFLPIGHTHEDIDHSFSSNSAHLNDTITINDLHLQLYECLNIHSKVENLDWEINGSKIFEMAKCLTGTQRFTQFYYLCFY